LRNFCRDLLAYFRDLMVVKVSGDARLLETSAATSAELESHAEQFSESDLVRFFRSLADTENSLKEAAHPRYQVEVGLVKLMEMRRLAPLSQLVERVAALEESLRTGKPVPANATPTGSSGGSVPSTGGKPAGSSTRSAAGGSRAMAEEPPAMSSSSPMFGSAAAAPARERDQIMAEPQRAEAISSPPGMSETTGTAPTLQASGEVTIFDRVRGALEEKRKMRLLAALEGAQNVSFTDDEMCAEFAPADRHFRDTFDKANCKVLQEVCKEVTGRDLSFRFLIKSADGNGPVSPEEEERREQQRLREAAEAHPGVQQMLRTFRGEIIEVKRVRE